MFSNIKEWILNKVRSRITKLVNSKFNNIVKSYKSYTKEVLDLSPYERDLIAIKLYRLINKHKEELIDLCYIRLINEGSIFSCYLTGFKSIKENIDRYMDKYTFSYLNDLLGIYNKELCGTSYLLNNDGSRLLQFTEHLLVEFRSKLIEYAIKLHKVTDKNNRYFNSNQKGFVFHNTTDKYYVCDIEDNPRNDIVLKNSVLTFWLYVKLLHPTYPINVARDVLSYYYPYCHMYYLGFINEDYGKHNYKYIKISTFNITIEDSLPDEDITWELIEFKDFDKLKDNKYHTLDIICKLSMMYYLFKNITLHKVRYPKVIDKLKSIYALIKDSQIGNIVDPDLMEDVYNYIYRYNNLENPIEPFESKIRNKKMKVDLVIG